MLAHNVTCMSTAATLRLVPVWLSPCLWTCRQAVGLSCQQLRADTHPKSLSEIEFMLLFLAVQHADGQLAVACHEASRTPLLLACLRASCVSWTV